MVNTVLWIKSILVLPEAKSLKLYAIEYKLGVIIEKLAGLPEDTTSHFSHCQCPSKKLMESVDLAPFHDHQKVAGGASIIN